ncbi:MAG: hypothetical protein V2A73_09300, partial [Pseudomonadota bacterium]
ANVCGWCGSGSWSTTVFEGGSETSFVSALAVDAQGWLHVVYSRGNNDAWGLAYAYRNSDGAWSFEDLRSQTSKCGSSSSIAADNLGVYISTSCRLDSGDEVLKVVSRPFGASAWTVTTVDASPGLSLGWSSSIAVDGTGGAHVAYPDSTSSDLRYAYLPYGGGQSWKREVIDSTGKVGVDPDLAVDYLNGVHIVHHDATNGAVKYAYRAINDTEWKSEPIDSSVGSENAVDQSIAVDSSGGIHVLYVRATKFVKYAFKGRSDTSWSYSTLTSGNKADDPVSIFVDSKGAVHAAWLTYEPTSMMYAERTASSWGLPQQISDQYLSPYYPALAVDPTGRVHYFYGRWNPPDVIGLWYATRCP